MTDDPSYGVRYWEEVLADLGLEDLRWWYRDDDGDHGMSRDEAVAVLEECAVLIDVGGSAWIPEFERAQRTVLIDCDAPFTQIRLADGDEGWIEVVDAHDVLATIAVNLAEGRAPIPDGGRRWIPTRPPIHLPMWEPSPVPDGAWTTVTSWTAYGSMYWEMEEFRQKDAEYVRLRDLPSLAPGVTFELALAGDAPRRQLNERGWEIVDPEAVSRTPHLFRDYLAGSHAELSVAKQAYVRGRTGAFNDRSLDYLACGRPVVCSDTGLDWLPTGEGLLPFADTESAAAAVREVEADPQRHGAAARRIAEAFFSADRVLCELLDAAGVEVPSRP
jgi:Glycosyl transferases group 1